MGKVLENSVSGKTWAAAHDYVFQAREISFRLAQRFICGCSNIVNIINIPKARPRRIFSIDSALKYAQSNPMDCAFIKNMSQKT